MRSGQQTWRDEEEELAWEERKARLQAITPEELACIADGIHEALLTIDTSGVHLSRAGWRAVDKINAEVRKLR